MYKVAFVVSSGELVTYPWMNLQTMFEENDLYEFVVFQQEQCLRLFAEMQLDSFDGVVFSSNVSNDRQIRDLISANKKTIDTFISRGKGVLILLQYHLAKNNCAFDVVGRELFDDINSDKSNQLDMEDALYGVTHLDEHGDTISREQNAVVLTEGKFDSNKIYWDSKSVILSYPNKIIPEELYFQSQNSQYVQSFAPAYISYYPHAYFTAPFCLNDTKQNGEIGNRRPLLIYSANEDKRVVITTLPVDLQEQKAFLENMISYITRGRPDAVLWKDSSCTSCRGNCSTQDYLRRAKIHYYETSKQDFFQNIDIINRAKYVIACGETAFASYRDCSPNISLPIKTTLSSVLLNNLDEKDKRIIIDVPTVSQIELWANQGFDYLLSRFPQNEQLDNKWDSLYATRQVVLLAADINRTIPRYIVEQLKRYLIAHNKDNESFDKVERATHAAADICETLDIDLNFIKKTNISEESLPKITSRNVENFSLFDLAQHVLFADRVENIPEVYQITTRFISERNFGKASWEDDIMTTASVLRALIRIDRCPNINTSITNIVCSCYQDTDCLELTSSLSASIERSRQSEYELRVNYEKKYTEFQQKQEDYNLQIVELNDKVSQLNHGNEKKLQTISQYKDLNSSLKNKNSRLGAWSICILGLLIYFITMFVSFIVTAKSIDQKSYISEINHFFISWGIGGTMVTVLAIIITIKLFKILYASDIKKGKKGDSVNDE